MNARKRADARAGLPMFFVLSSVAMVFLFGASIGYFQPERVPQLAEPAVMWSLLFVGLMIDAAALGLLLAARRKRDRA